MNHINEGIHILCHLGVDHETLQAFCLHPIVQTDDDLKASRYTRILRNCHQWPILLAMEYRSVANAYLSARKICTIDEIQLSPLQQVNWMLIADKVQNYKDFSRFKHLYHNKDALELYFTNWFLKLEISQEWYRKTIERL